MQFLSVFSLFVGLLFFSSFAYGEEAYQQEPNQQDQYQQDQQYIQEQMPAQPQIQGQIAYQPNNDLNELSIVDVASQGTVYNKRFAPGSRYQQKFVVGFAVLVERPNECTFYVGQELEAMASETKAMAAVGILQAPSLTPKKIALKAMGAKDSFVKCDEASKGQPVEALLGLELVKTNPQQKQLNQAIVLNNHIKPEHYILTLDLATEQVSLRRTR